MEHPLYTQVEDGINPRGDSSPRSSMANETLSQIERALREFREIAFALVDDVGRTPECKSKLAVLTGRLEELRYKKLDAVQSVNLTRAQDIKTRRVNLGKECDILIQLTTTLHESLSR